MSEDDIRRQIEQLQAQIEQHKQALVNPPAPAPKPPSYGYRPTPATYHQPYNSYYGGRNNTYVNPSYKPPSNKYIRPGYAAPVSTSGATATQEATAAKKPPVAGPSSIPTTAPSARQTLSTTAKEVVLNGVAFESSGRSLVRKDLPKPVSSVPPVIPRKPHHHAYHHPYARAPDFVPSRGRYAKRGRRSRNMTLDNTGRDKAAKKAKQYSDKPCPMYTTKGACTRGLTCPYQHDPAKVAICWNFLQDDCPYTAETCALSHDPTPERTPLCVHFSNKGRCTRAKCPFPHVKVGPREGVCRDFAVLGYCSKGVDCDKQHVRECPDFAENGTCANKRTCKLPHVIRANRGRKAAVPVSARWDPAPSDGMSVDVPTKKVTAEDGEIGDDYISLTFNESDESDETSESSDGGSSEEEEEEEEMDEDDGEEAR